MPGTSSSSGHSLLGRPDNGVLDLRIEEDARHARTQAPAGVACSVTAFVVIIRSSTRI